MVKRTFTEYDEDGSAEGGPSSKAQLSGGNTFAMKFLFSEAEMRAIGQQGAEIQEMSGATLATTGEFYPATTFQELNIAGPNTEAVLSAAIYAIAHIVQVEGGVTNGEEGVPPGEGRLRTVVPTKAAAAVIGKGGASIAEIRAATKLHVHVDKAKVPPEGGVIAEQIVSLSGPLAGLQDGLAMVLEHVHALVVESWFGTWATSTNVGLEFPEVTFELSGKGMRKGEELPGKGSTIDVTADTSLGVSGEVCQFFARSGWCRWGEACRHVHTGGPAIPVGLPTAGGVDSSVFSVAAGAAGEACEFFAKAGWCKFGDSCRYVHQHAGDSTPTVGGAVAAGLGVARPSAISVLNAFGVRGLDGGSDELEAAAPNTRKSGEICLFFQKSGWCKYGGQCHHAHVGGPTVATAGPATVAREGPPGHSGEVCRIFQRTGSCKWGSACHHLHDSAAGSSGGDQAGAYDINGFPRAPAGAAPAAARPSATGAGELCQFFARTGTCKWGSQCKYVHDGAAASSGGGQAGAYDINGFPIRGKTAAPAPEAPSSLCNEYLE